MQRNALIFLFGYLLVANCSSSVNYCGSKMCNHSNYHTFCQFREGPSSTCINYIEAHLSLKEKISIIARLNKRRSEAARGMLRGLPSAGDMLKLRWVEELAREAQRWADQCRPPRMPYPEEHDSCRDLYSVTVGQCVASVVGEAPGLRVESFVDMWHLQSLYYTGNVSSYLLPPSNNRFHGDFGQILWSRTYMVGCGRSRFMAWWRGRLRSVERLVCNFAPRGPTPGHALWAPSLPATACPPRSRPDPSLKSLCSFQYDLNETNDFDDKMTLEEHIILNTVLKLEKNASLNYLGSLDELYLTKLAIITIGNSHSTGMYFHPTKDNVGVLVPSVLEEYVSRENESKTNTENFVQLKNKNDYFAKMKISLIGRPKCYNMEDLNDDNDKQKENYATEGKIINDNNALIDMEYDGVIGATIIRDKIEEDKITKANKVNATSLEDYLSRVIYVNDTTVLDNIVSTVKFSSDIDQKNDEDYLSDPETIHELQEALYQMERTLSQMEKTTLSGKVRRELRNNTEDFDSRETLKQIAVLKSKSEELDSEEQSYDNRTQDRGPMLKMVLKYMPYLKQYESTILGSATSKANYAFVFFSLPYCFSVYLITNVYFSCNSIFLTFISLTF